MSVSTTPDAAHDDFEDSTADVAAILAPAALSIGPAELTRARARRRFRRIVARAFGHSQRGLPAA